MTVRNRNFAAVIAIFFFLAFCRNVDETGIRTWLSNVLSEGMFRGIGGGKEGRFRVGSVTEIRA